MTQVANFLNARSAALVFRLETRMLRLVFLWCCLASFACGLRLAFPITEPGQGFAALSAFLSYGLVVIAPITTILLMLNWFNDDAKREQPVIRLSRYGRWDGLDQEKARDHPFFGTSGLMASLLLGVLINIPVRTAEFMFTVPAIGGFAPGWLQILHTTMILDVAVVNSLYAAAFAMALRKVPMFPRFLLFVWLVDINAQLWIAQMVANAGDLPVDVARPLEKLLSGNISKVLISAALWLPYLILSKRVNMTYRWRVRNRPA
jgi:hypothetical protein